MRGPDEIVNEDPAGVVSLKYSHRRWVWSPEPYATTPLIGGEPIYPRFFASKRRHLAHVAYVDPNVNFNSHSEKSRNKIVKHNNADLILATMKNLY